MRSCKVFKYQRENGSNKPERVLEGQAIFHGFSTDYEEFESGPGNFPCCIVEFWDGSLVSRHVEMVRFDEPTQPKHTQEWTSAQQDSINALRHALVMANEESKLYEGHPGRWADVLGKH